MKHTKKRLLALALVLAMAIGMVPFAALSVGAEVTAATEIVVGDDGAIENLEWTPGYMSSMLNYQAPDGFVPWEVVKTESWGELTPYRYTGIMSIPKAGTTLIWSEPVPEDANGDPMLMRQNYLFLSSWKETSDNVWEIDYAGANLKSDYTYSSSNNKVFVSANYIYDADAATVTYTYTTTQDNETVRFGCYGVDAEGNLATNSAECPTVYAINPVFEEGETAGSGTVGGVLWFDGYVGSYSHTQGFANEILNGAGSSTYDYSSPIMVPKAGTTISFTDTGNYSSAAAYVFSAWRAGDDGRLELIYGCPGDNTVSAGSAWLTVNKEGDTVVSQTYSYTTSYDNEIIRLTYRRDDGETPTVYYTENNAENLAPLLTAAGYDPTVGGVPYVLSWYTGAVSAEDGNVAIGNSKYYFSDILAVYGKGTKVTFVDMMGDTEAGVDNFAGENIKVFGKFDGTDYDGSVGAIELRTPVEGGAAGATAAEREAAVEAGRLVYTYTTTEDKEYLRMTVACTGNTVNGHFVSPIIYMGKTDTAYAYSELEGLTVVTLGDSYMHGSSALAENTWLAMLSSRYGMKNYNYGIGGSTVATDTGKNPMVDRYESMVDVDADIVIFEGGRNDYNSSVPIGEVDSTDPATFCGAVNTVVEGLMEKYPNALIICVTAWDVSDSCNAYAEAFTECVEALNNNRVCVLSAYDHDIMPVFMRDATFKTLYSRTSTDVSHLSPAGHRLVLPWFEALIGNAYRDYLGAFADGQGVKFMVDDTVVDARGTVTQGYTMTAPAATSAVCAENMFGWYGVVTNGDAQRAMLIRVGEQVTFSQGDVAVFEPLTLDIRQSTAMLRLKDDGTNGLRFLSGVSKTGYQDLLDMIAAGELGNATLTFGTLIVPYDYVIDMQGELTHAALAEAELDNIDVACNIVLNAAGAPVWYQEDATTGYIAGSLHSIRTHNHSRDFTAAGYAKLTVDGEDYYAYAENGGKNGTSVYELAIAALNDLSATQDVTHKIEIDNDLYSAYTMAQRAILAEYVNDVVSLETAANGVTAELIEYEYYDPNSNWETVWITEQDEIWWQFVAALGDSNATSICVIMAAEGANPSAAGGFLLDGIMWDCAELEYAGVTCYLIGFSDYGVNY